MIQRKWCLTVVFNIHMIKFNDPKISYDFLKLLFSYNYHPTYSCVSYCLTKIKSYS